MAVLPSPVSHAFLVCSPRLRWNLDGGRPLEFGSLISSSNELTENRVTVETSAPLLWTTGLRQR